MGLRLGLDLELRRGLSLGLLGRRLWVGLGCGRRLMRRVIWLGGVGFIRGVMLGWGFERQ